LKPKHTAPPRGTTAERGYGTAHVKQRRRFLKLHPICQRCEDRFATDLHHKDGNPFNRAESNLEAVCEGCHHGVIHGR